MIYSYSSAFWETVQQEIGAVKKSLTYPFTAANETWLFHKSSCKTAMFRCINWSRATRNSAIMCLTCALPTGGGQITEFPGQCLNKWTPPANTLILTPCLQWFSKPWFNEKWISFSLVLSQQAQWHVCHSQDSNPNFLCLKTIVLHTELPAPWSSTAAVLWHE